MQARGGKCMKYKKATKSRTDKEVAAMKSKDKECDPWLLMRGC